VPTRFEASLDADVDNTASIGLHALLDTTREHGDFDVVDRNAEKAAPAANLGGSLGRGSVSASEHHSAQDPDPTGGSVPCVRHDRRLEPALAAAAFPPIVEGVFDPRRTVQDRGRR
jgi:hypothetical protein